MAVRQEGVEVGTESGKTAHLEAGEGTLLGAGCQHPCEHIIRSHHVGNPVGNNIGSRLLGLEKGTHQDFSSAGQSTQNLAPAEDPAQGQGLKGDGPVPVEAEAPGCVPSVLGQGPLFVKHEFGGFGRPGGGKDVTRCLGGGPVLLHGRRGFQLGIGCRWAAQHKIHQSALARSLSIEHHRLQGRQGPGVQAGSRIPTKSISLNPGQKTSILALDRPTISSTSILR